MTTPSRLRILFLGQKDSALAFLKRSRLTRTRLAISNPQDMRTIPEKQLPSVKETYGADVGCTEDGRNGRIGATRYAGGNGTRKEAEKRNV